MSDGSIASLRPPYLSVNAWTFRRLKKPRCREMSARGYALHSVCTQLSFLFLSCSPILVPPPDVILLGHLPPTATLLLSTLYFPALLIKNRVAVRQSFRGTGYKNSGATRYLKHGAQNGRVETEVSL